MSTRPISINGKPFNIELVTYKAGTEELLNKNLAAKFGKGPVEAMFKTGTEIDVSSLINNAKKDKALSKTLDRDIENAVEAGIKSKLNAIYGEKEPPSTTPPDEGEEVVPPDDIRESGNPLLEAGPATSSVPIVYAVYHTTKYAYITIAMQENLWELFNSNGARFRRMLAGWGEAFKNKETREKIGQWLMSTPSSAALGGQAAVNWLSQKLQNRVGINRQRNQWKKADSNEEAVEKFEKREEKNRQKELDRVRDGGQYRSFETATDYEGYKARKKNQILGKGLERGAVRSTPSTHDKWNPRTWIGTNKELSNRLRADFGEEIASGRAEIGKGSGVKLQKLDPPKRDEDKAENEIERHQKSGKRFFVVVPYETGSNKVKYKIDADSDTKRWIETHPADERLKESASGKMTTISFSQLKKFILESLNDKSSIQGFEKYSESELKKLVIDQVFDRIDDAGVDESEFSFKKIAIYGSRSRGTAKPDSDLDVVVEYSGTMREDDVFNILHDEDYEYGTMSVDGIAVDVNPIREEESGNISEFIKKAKFYGREADD